MHIRLAALLALPTLAASASAQPLLFGQADDPLEVATPSVARPQASAAAFAGPAFLGAQWVGGGRFEAEAQRGRLSAAFGTTLHFDENGFVGPETDELYDLARLVRYVRLAPRPGLPLYARLGPPRRVEFSTGHLVRGYTTTTAWDERTLGVEAAFASGPLAAQAFVDDVRLNGVGGVRVEVAPARGAAGARLASLRIGVGAVHDLGLRGDSATTAVQADVRLDAVRFGGLALAPWVSVAEYLNYGRGLGVGADVGAADLVGTARVRLRLGAFVSSARFVPGYVNAFYPVANVRDRIVSADAFYDADTTDADLAGTPLSEAEGGLDLVGELRVLGFGAFEVYGHLRRHVGNTPQSAVAVRLAARPRTPDGLRLELAFERQGFGSVFGLFGELRDQNALVLDADAPLLAGRARLGLRARYGYRRLPDAPEGGARYLVERRFEPLVGLRVRL